MSDKTELSPQQTRALTLLLNGKSVSETAELVEVSRSTVYNWMADPTFRDELQQAQRAVVQEAITYLANSSMEAAQTLIKIANAPEVPASVRLQAIKMILFDAIRLRQSADFYARLEKLEGHVEMLT